ncbi:MAG: hypothetical protein D8M59_17100 [Planctomycetes bacterium]|nr:hypothetical protein [Planctomycetota bacterium]
MEFLIIQMEKLLGGVIGLLLFLNFLICVDIGKIPQRQNLTMQDFLIAVTLSVHHIVTISFQMINEHVIKRK